MGPGSWQLGKAVYDTNKSLIELLRKELEDLPSKQDVTAWMDLVRTCRHPQTLWTIDYILPSKDLETVNELIRSSETILYGDKRNLSLLENYSADVYQEIAFHTIRAHLRAEENDFETALAIFSELLTWLDRLPLIRQSNLLMHACLAFLCSRMWQESLDCLNRHWGMLKYADPSERDSLGLWDNEILMRQIYWFFMEYSHDFRSFYASKTGLLSNELWRHKKIGLLYLLSYDHSWVVSFCGRPFYEHACSIMPDLPKYQVQSSTPRNIRNISFEQTPITQEADRKQSYLKRYDELSRQDTRAIDHDLLNDYLYSYLACDADRVQNFNKIIDLLILMDEIFGRSALDSAESIVDLGCGLTLMESGKIDSHKYLGVDISTEVDRRLRRAGFECVHMPISNFIESTSTKFDIGIASRVLELLNIHQCHAALKFLSEHCNTVCITIDLTDQNVRLPNHIKCLNKISQTIDQWKDSISRYCSGEYRESEDLLHFCGRKR